MSPGTPRGVTAARRHDPCGVVPRPAAPSPTSTHRVLHGRYEVGDRIGFGATADVHRGHDIRVGRPVAIKILRTHLAQSPQFQSSFQREARTTAALSHPAIVSVYDIGYEEVEQAWAGPVSVPFIVMEHIPGRSLRDILRDGGLTLDAALRHQLGVLAALDHSHRAGIVHRDIKPANVMVTPEGSVKVVDFGLARVSGDPDATLTLARSFLGTPSYVSPEQVRGETADVRSDLYSAGCLLYELLTGRPPFVGEDPVSLAYKHVYATPARVSTTIPALDSVLVKALAKDREDRFKDAHAFTEALLSAAKDRIHTTITALT